MHIALALVLIALLAPARASTQAPETLELEWRAPPGCPNGDAVRARVSQLLGNRGRADGPVLHAVGTITREAGGELHLHLVVTERELVGERHIEGHSCRDLAASAAVALALLLRASPATREDEPVGASALGGAGSSPTAPGQASSPETSGQTPSPSPSTASPPPPVRSDLSDLAERPQRPRRARLLLQLPLAAISAVGPSSKPSYGFGAGVGVAVGRWRVLAEAKAWLPSKLTTERELERYSVDVRRFTAGLRGCPAFTWSRFDLSPCVVLAVEHLAASGTGPHIAGRTAKSTWIAPGIGAQMRIRVASWLRFVAGIDVQIHTARPTLAIDGVGRVERLSPAGIAAALGAEWNL